MKYLNVFRAQYFRWLRIIESNYACTALYIPQSVTVKRVAELSNGNVVWIIQWPLDIIVIIQKSNMLTYPCATAQCACLLPILSVSHSQMHHRKSKIFVALPFHTDTHTHSTNGYDSIVRSEFARMKWIENLFLRYCLVAAAAVTVYLGSIEHYCLVSMVFVSFFSASILCKILHRSIDFWVWTD